MLDVSGGAVDEEQGSDRCDTMLQAAVGIKCIKDEVVTSKRVVGSINRLASGLRLSVSG